MDTLQILRYVTPYQRKNIFKGVFACDNLPRKVILPALYIINLAPKTESGSHWVSLYINKRGRGFYFDSFGFEPKNKHIIAFMKMHSKTFDYNNKQLQLITSTKCGKYCCVYAVSVLRSRAIKQLLKKFSINLYVNEIIIEKMYDHLKIV